MDAKQKIDGERDLIAELRKVAEQIAAEGHAGWGNTCLDAAQTLASKEAEVARLRKIETRYQWLSDRYLGADFEYGENDLDMRNGTPVLLISFDAKTVYGGLDETIDAALTPQPPKD